MPLLKSLNGITAVLQNGVPPNEQQGDIALAQLEDFNAPEHHLFVAPEPAVGGEDALVVFLQVDDADEAGPIGGAAGELLGVQQIAVVDVAVAQLDAAAIGWLGEGNSATTAPEDPLLPIVPQLSPPGSFYLGELQASKQLRSRRLAYSPAQTAEALGKASGVALAVFCSILGIAYRALQLVLPPNDEADVERAYDEQTSTLPGSYREVLDSEPIAFEPAVMPKSVYFCH